MECPAISSRTTMRRKERRCPEVLRRAYGNDRVRTLGDAIHSLLLPLDNVAELRSERRRPCRRGHRSNGAAADSFLLKHDDTVEYEALLTRTFAVVNESAQPLSNPSRANRWKQDQIVRNTIGIIAFKSSGSSNVICSGYDKRTHVSPLTDSLSTLAWNILLSRIGDEVMVYLLMYVSIFLPLTSKILLQVTGPPINKIVEDRIKNRGRKKRKVDTEEKPYLDVVHGIHLSSNSLGTIDSMCYGMANIGDKSRKRSRLLSWQHQQLPNSSKSNVLQNYPPIPEEDTISNRRHSDIHDIDRKTRKRTRLFSWQRHRKHQKLTDFSEKNAQKNSTDIAKEDLVSNRKQLQQGDNTSWSRQKGYSMDLQMTSRCFCSLAWRAPRRVMVKTQIDRQDMFYNSNFSRHSVFPSNHILNKLKPNDPGAVFLICHIFGIADAHLIAEYLPCLHNYGHCPFRLDCRYHSLKVFLKHLIRKAQRCQYTKLLERHCFVPALNPPSNSSSTSISEGQQAGVDLSLFHVCKTKKNYNCLQLSSCNLPLKMSLGHIDTQETERPRSSSPKINDQQQFELNGSYCKNEQVVSFIWAVCRSIVPMGLLGTPCNWRALRKNIAKFVELRRFEKFYLEQGVYGLKTNCFPFLSKGTCISCCMCDLKNNDEFQRRVNLDECHEESTVTKEALQKYLSENWIYWFFSCLVVPIIRTHFYVTESETGKQDIFYYRKQIWKKIMNQSIFCLTNRNYQFLDCTSFRKIICNTDKRKFGFSKVRFLPKENGVRPISNHKARSKALLPITKQYSENYNCGMGKRKIRAWESEIAYRKSSENNLDSEITHVSSVGLERFVSFSDVNSALRDIYSILKRLKVENPDKLGGSVFDYNDVYKQLCPFLSGLRNGLMNRPKVFIVVCDVSKAFDSVDQDKLLNVMKDVLHQDEYLLNRYAQVLCRRKMLDICYENAPIEDSSSNNIIKSAASFPFASSLCVLVDQVSRKSIKHDDISDLLKEHIKRNVLQVGPDFYLQSVGIPQGSVLSSLLCSFYYGHLEREVIFPLLEKVDAGLRFNNEVPKHMLIRLIDDFLFISTSKKEASFLFSIMQRGFREYNCSMNVGKFGLNFGMGVGFQPEHFPNRVYRGVDGVSFLPWSGLLINCNTLEIQADYTRYWGTHVCATLTVSRQAEPGPDLKAKLCGYMRPKCHPLFYDSNINSSAVVRLNAYQAFLLCAMKFHCYVRAMPNTRGLGPDYYMEIIRSYLYKLIKKRMHTMSLTANLTPILLLKKDEVEWLGLCAYIRVLRKKQSHYMELLERLRSKVGRYGNISRMPNDLKYAVDDSHSSMFWKIKY